MPINAKAEPELTSSVPVVQSHDAFQNGLKAYQNKQFSEAKSHFSKSLEEHPNNAAALFNLGLTSHQLGQVPWAIAYFRRTLNLRPGLAEARQALDLSLSQLEIKEIPHQIENYEIVREHLLIPVSVNTYFWIFIGMFFVTGWSLIQYLGRRKKALDEELPLPAFPWFSGGTGVIGVLILVLAIMKFYDSQVPRATVVDNKVVAQGAPGENQLNLFDLYGGFEVIIRDHQGDWAQVTYPGALTGWIKKSSLYITSGGSTW